MRVILPKQEIGTGIRIIINYSSCSEYSSFPRIRSEYSNSPVYMKHFYSDQIQIHIQNTLFITPRGNCLVTVVPCKHRSQIKKRKYIREEVSMLM